MNPRALCSIVLIAVCILLLSEQGKLAGQPPAGTFPSLPVPDAQTISNKASPADALKRSSIPADVLAKLGSGNNDAPKELVAVLGKAGGKQVVSLTITADGKSLAIMGLNDTKARIVDLATGKETKSFGELQKAGDLTCISPNGALLALGGRGQTVDVFEIATGNVRTTIASEPKKAAKGGKGGKAGKGGNTTVLELAFSGDSNLLAVGDSGGSIKVWDFKTKMDRVIKPEFTAINRMAFSPDGKFLACSGTVGKAGQIAIMEVASGKNLGNLIGHKAVALGLAWHPNGQQIATSSKDGTIRIWDLATMKEMQALATDAAELHGLAWHPSGDFLASGNHTGGTITLYDMRRTPPRFRVINLYPPNAAATKAATNSNNDLVFTPEGRHLIAANLDGTVSVLRLAEVGTVLK